MQKKLHEIINKQAIIESLIQEADEWFNAYHMLSARKKLLDTYGSGSDEQREYSMSLLQEMEDAKALYEGAFKEVATITGESVEGTRILITKLRATMGAFLDRITAQQKELIKDNTEDQLLGEASALLKLEEEGV